MVFDKMKIQSIVRNEDIESDFIMMLFEYFFRKVKHQVQKKNRGKKKFLFKNNDELFSFRYLKLELFWYQTESYFNMNEFQELILEKLIKEYNIFSRYFKLGNFDDHYRITNP